MIEFPVKGAKRFIVGEMVLLMLPIYQLVPPKGLNAHVGF